MVHAKAKPCQAIWVKFVFHIRATSRAHDDDEQENVCTIIGFWRQHDEKDNLI